MLSLQKRRSRVSPAETITVIFLLLVVVALAATSGCAATRQARRAHLARVDLAGITKAELKACAGPPVRIEYTGGWEYLTYASPMHENQLRSTQCIATFVLKNGYVEDLQYSNPSGGLIGKSIGECLPIVDACLPKEKKD